MRHGRKVLAIVRILTRPHPPLAFKRDQIVALIRDKPLPLGSYAALHTAEERSRDRLRVLGIRFRDILLAPQARVALAVLAGILAAYLLISIGYDKEWSGWRGMSRSVLNLRTV
jgi:hypothetical protein